MKLIKNIEDGKVYKFLGFEERQIESDIYTGGHIDHLLHAKVLDNEDNIKYISALNIEFLK